MKKDEFLQLLHDEMIRFGATPETAEHHARVIDQTFTPDDIARIERITNSEEVAKLAQAIVSMKSKPSAEAKEEAAKDVTSAEILDTADEEEEDTDEEWDTDDSDMKVYTAGSIPESLPTVADITDEDTFYEEMIRDDEEDGFVTHVSPRGKKAFWIIFACSLPLILILLVLYFSAFAILFAALCSLIVLLVAGLIGGAAVGAAVSFICIVYGISQLITVASAAPGLYEIGLGITVGGTVMLFGILIYNLAIRLVPQAIRLLGTLFRFCTGKLRELFGRAKEACYKL